MRIFLLFLACLPALGQGFDAAWLNALEWRSLGPGSIGGRVSAIEGVPGNPRLIYAATGSGGLFKSTNGGTTWKPIFERPDTISIGDIAIDPHHPDTVWVGTGEANVRNSVSFGSGVFASSNGGKTWERRGLRDTMTISRIRLDPRDARRVLVAAVGHPFGPNAERGVFLSSDAGQSWKKTLYIDEHHGASDLDIDAGHPDTVFAGMWRFDRKPWRYDSGGEDGGLYKSVDGGATWKKVTNGLPKLMGRLGVKVAPSDSRIVYVVAETREGSLFRSSDGGETFQVVSKDRGLTNRGYYYCDLRVDPQDANRVYVLENALQVSANGGRTFQRIGGSVHGDLQALWIDPKDPSRMWQGSDGGLASTWDAGETWRHVANLSLGQFYHVYADDRKPFYQVSGGTQDNGTWTGPSRTREPAGILNSDWRMVSPIVGFHVLSDAGDPDVLLSQTPGGTLLRTDLRTRQQQNIGPQVRNYGGATAEEMKFRFAWDAPLIRSPHGRNTFYYAGNVVFQSSDQGKSWEPISRDLSKADRAKMQPSGGPVFTDNSSSETYGAITRLAESPAKQGLIWAGTDDGNLQVTQNGGGAWVEVGGNIAALPPGSPVSAVEASRRDANVAYAAFDRHMLDDLRPYLFKTSDGGRTWKKVTAGLPEQGFIWVIREDPKNPAVLYLGTEVGIYVSFDGGERWLPFGLKNLPNVAVRDVTFQEESNDILIATHGRGLYVLDDAAPVQQARQAAAPAGYFFPPRAAMRHAVRATQGNGGDTEFVSQNPPYGAALSYILKAPQTGVRLDVMDAAGKPVRTLSAPGAAGWNRVAWDLRAEPVGRGRGAQVLPGDYTIRLAAGGFTAERKLTVALDPELRVDSRDLEAQWQALRQLAEVMRGVGAMIHDADQRSGSGEWKQFRDTLARPGNLSASETGPRLSEQLAGLFGLMEAPDAAPTAAMQTLFLQLRGEYEAASAKWKALQR